MTDRQNQYVYGGNATEAVLNAKSYDPKTHVHIPHEYAVEAAKDWVEENEK